MQEYSRKATIAESRLEEIHKRSVHHDDHLRVIDAWLGQVSLIIYMICLTTWADMPIRCSTKWSFLLTPKYQQLQAHQVSSFASACVTKLTRLIIDPPYLSSVAFK